MLWLMFIAVGFLSGSIMFCQIIPKLVKHKNISALSDDGNPGAFNVFAHCGKGMGILCLCLDILKGFIPVFTASFFVDTGSLLFAPVIFAPVLGHAVGLFNGLHGGKCIAVSFGVTAGLVPVTCLPFVTLCALYIFFSAIVRIKPNRKCSIVVYTCFMVASAVILNILGYYAAALGCGLVSAAAIVKHLNFNLKDGKTSENCTDCN